MRYQDPRSLDARMWPDIRDISFLLPDDTMSPPKALSLRGLLAWLQKKDPEQDYDYKSGSNCLIAQYLTRALCAEVYVGQVHFVITQREWHPLPRLMDFIARERPWTFGAAAERCRDLLREGYE